MPKHDGRVPYKERVTFMGPGHLRDGEEHAAHPDVMGLLLTTKDPEAPHAVELWLRASDEQCDAEGHSVFVPIDTVSAPRELHPGARSAVDWRKMR